jgi:hypothetical protein
MNKGYKKKSNIFPKKEKRKEKKKEFRRENSLVIVVIRELRFIDLINIKY